jgi:S-adenosylmethionine:tRNA ribosyltransferase-isomerase
VIGPNLHRSIVDGILTGVHDPAESHFQLLQAFADESLLNEAWQHATDNGYRGHEFGDVCLIL